MTTIGESTIPASARDAAVNLANGAIAAGALLGGASLYWIASPLIVGGTTAEVDTGLDLPAKAVVYDVLVDVLVAEVTGTTKTLDIGLLSSESGGDADGLVDGIDVSTTGIKRAGFALSTTWFGSNTRGVLLSSFTAGASADDRGLYMEKPFIAGSVTAKSLSYSRGSTLTEFQGKFYVLVAVLPS